MPIKLIIWSPTLKNQTFAHSLKLNFQFLSLLVEKEILRGGVLPVLCWTAGVALAYPAFVSHRFSLSSHNFSSLTLGICRVIMSYFSHQDFWHTVITLFLNSTRLKSSFLFTQTFFPPKSTFCLYLHIFFSNILKIFDKYLTKISSQSFAHLFTRICQTS